MGTGAAWYVFDVAVGSLESLGTALRRRGTLGGARVVRAGAFVWIVAGLATLGSLPGGGSWVAV